jgi:NTE family protein
MATKKVAIACQGGGTHAAFTWGVLRTVLETKKRWDANPRDGDTFDIIALSGTSAGALCALAAWYGLAPNTADADCGTIDKAIERLDFLWTTFAATTPTETAHNKMIGTLLHWKSQGLPFPGSNPYDAHASLGLTGLSMMGARQEYLGFPALLEAVCPNFDRIDWPRVAKADLRIIVGAIEVLSGNFEIFDSDKTLEQMGLLPDGREIDQYDIVRWRMRRAMSLEGVAASGTLPEVLPAQVIRSMRFPTCDPGRIVTRNGYYWDGLYSRNPPVRDLLDAQTKDEGSYRVSGW